MFTIAKNLIKKKFFWPYTSNLLRSIPDNTATKLFKTNQAIYTEMIALVASLHSCSEYDVFCKSGNDWSISNQRVQNDFSTYLASQQPPFYVNSYVRKQLSGFNSGRSTRNQVNISRSNQNQYMEG